jgi:hypothetical protein
LATQDVSRVAGAANRFERIQLSSSGAVMPRPPEWYWRPMKHFVFTMTTGRSGTKYLADLLQQNLSDAECHHEICGWDRFGVDTPDVSHMTLFNSQGNVDKVQAFWQSKLGRIAETERRFYVETSHILMKAGLVENLIPLTSEGLVHLVALERDPYATIVSFRNRYDFWDTANRWLWYLDPRYPRNLVPSRELFAQGINGLCLWYVLEIRARAARYERLFRSVPGIVFHHFTLEELGASRGAARLLRELGVRADPEHMRLPQAQNVGRLLVALDAAEQTSIRRLIASAGLQTSAQAHEAALAWVPH